MYDEKLPELRGAVTGGRALIGSFSGISTEPYQIEFFRNLKNDQLFHHFISNKRSTSIYLNIQNNQMHCY